MMDFLKNKRYSRFPQFSKGQSLLEVIIAVAVGTIAILAAITALTLILRIGQQDSSLQTAAFLEQKIIDDITVAVNRDWQQIANASEGQNYYLAPAVSEGTFEIKSGSDTRAINSIDYDAYFQVSPISRDVDGNIMPVYDPLLDDSSTKKVDVFVSWLFKGETSVAKVSKYITRNRNLVFHQTNWSGGPTGPSSDPVVTNSDNSFFSVTGNIDFGTRPGELKLGF